MIEKHHSGSTEASSNLSQFPIMSSKIIIICMFVALFAIVTVNSQFVYTPYVYSPYVPYYSWVWGSGNKNGGSDGPMPPPPSAGGPGPNGPPSFTNMGQRN